MLYKSERLASFLSGQGNFEPMEKGLMFSNPRKDIFEDLSRLNILACTVDTVRQLYRLQLDFKLYQEFEEAHDPVRSKGVEFHIHGEDFKLGSGGKSGYRFRLQNNEIGVIVFLKNRHSKVENFGSHVKIEFSPKFLFEHSPEEVQLFADGVATWLSSSPIEHSGCAVHLALDVQGWVPPEDILSNLTTRSRRIFQFDGIESADFDLSEVSATYGRRETLTIGSAKSVQLCLYNKTLQAKKSDSLHYYESVWQSQDKADFSLREYDPESPVYRLEYRFHHSVTRQFQKGSDMDFSSYKAIYDHLGALWQYGLDNVRYDYCKDTLHPVWQLFSEDADFNWKFSDRVYKRAYKKPGIGNEKNVALALGNWISIIARSGLSLPKAWARLKMSGMFEDIENYYRFRGIDRDGIYQLIGEGIRQRRLIGNAA